MASARAGAGLPGRGIQLEPASMVLNTPPPKVPAYSTNGERESRTSVSTHRVVRPFDASTQVAPPSTLLDTPLWPATYVAPEPRSIAIASTDPRAPRGPRLFHPPTSPANAEQGRRRAAVTRKTKSRKE